MKKHIALCAWAAVALVIFVFQAFAQVPDTIWSRTYGGTIDDYAQSVQETSDGGYIVAGVTYSLSGESYDFYVVKTNSQGDTLWTRTYGGSNYDEAWSVQQTADGGYIVAGFTQSFGVSGDFYLVKTNSSGDTLWTRTYGGGNWDGAYSVRQTADGGYIVAGSTCSFGAGTPSFNNFYLVRTNSQGDTLWTRTYGGSYGDVAWSVQETAGGGYIMAGITYSFGAGLGDCYLVKTNTQGDTLWTRTYGGSSDDQAYSVDQTADGGYIVAGDTRSFGAGEQDFYLVKTNSQGDTLWTRTYGGGNWDGAYSVRQTADGGYILAGYTESFGAGDYDLYLVKTNSQGDTVWTRTYGGSGDDGAYSVQQAADGGCIVAGWTDSFGAGLEDMWLVRTAFVSPTILSITDVGNDQGRQARIRWFRCIYDGYLPDYTITSYSIYRRIDEYLFGESKDGHSGLDWPPGEWEFIVTVPAFEEGTYATICPTLADSSSDGIYWSTFFIRAGTSDPGTYFDSEPDSGYSVDNLPPDVTLMTGMVSEAPGYIHLHWQAVTTGGGGQPEQGGVWYHVYGSTDPTFTPAPENLLTVTQELEFEHEIGSNDKYFYIIQASDDY